MKAIRFLALVLILGLTGCAASESSSLLESIVPPLSFTAPPPAFTPTAPPLPPTLTATPAPLPLDFPPATPPVFSPILYRNARDRYFSFQVLGGYQNGRWLTDEETYPLLNFGASYDVYAFDRFVGAAKIQVSEDMFVLPPFCGADYASSNLAEDIPNLFAFAQGWQVKYRPFVEMAADNPVYRQAVADWLASQGIADPQVQITRILRTDIEGDGTNEVFISATRFKNPDMPVTEMGDYSIVLMRKVKGGEALTVPLVADIYRSMQSEATYPYSYQIAGFFDFNQDANMEVVLNVNRWEGRGIVIYEAKGFNTTQVVKEICAE